MLQTQIFKQVATHAQLAFCSLKTRAYLFLYRFFFFLVHPLKAAVAQYQFYFVHKTSYFPYQEVPEMYYEEEKILKKLQKLTNQGNLFGFNLLDFSLLTPSVSLIISASLEKLFDKLLFSYQLNLFFIFILLFIITSVNLQEMTLLCILGTNG